MAAPVLVEALLLAAVTYVLARLVRTRFLAATERTQADLSTRYLVARLLHIAVLAVGGALVLGVLSVPLSAVIAVIGVVGLAISLALQDILKNFFAGLYLLFERPFSLGDRIAVREFSGRVQEIGWRTTVLVTEDQEEILIPNAIIFVEVVGNRTRVTRTPAKQTAATPTTRPVGEPHAPESESSPGQHGPDG